jgi:hypothetical protein
MEQGHKRIGVSVLLSEFWGVDRNMSVDAGVGDFWMISLFSLNSIFWH